MGKWDLSSGLPLDDTDVTIKSAEFGYNAKINNGETVCYNVTFAPDDGDEQEQSFSVGKGMTITGKGAGIEGRNSVNMSTNYGVLLGSMVKAVAEAGKDMDEEFPNDGGFFDASTFVGSRWHLGTVEVETMNPVTQEKKLATKVVATAYLGKAGKAAKAAAKADGGGSKAKGTNAARQLEDDDPKLYAKLLKLAKVADDHDEFMEEALSLDAVEGNKVANNAILDPKCLWADAHPED